MVVAAAACLALGAVATAHAARVSGECAPPRTRIMLCPLVDATDRSWSAWTGAEPAAVVRRMLADSLVHGRGRDVIVAPEPSVATQRPVEDALAMELGRRARAEVIVTGVIREFTQEDRREPGKFSRWGVGPPDARSFAEVRVSLRVLDVRDGSVLLESTVSRERRRKSAASVERLRSSDGVTPSRERAGESDVPTLPSGPLAEALDEVIADLVHSLDRRLDERWQARVLTAAGGACVLDAGATSGLFAGERLEIWRAGIETYDSDFLRVGEEVRVGVIVVTAFDGSGRAKARVAEGEALPGDRVRPCKEDPETSVTFRR